MSIKFHYDAFFYPANIYLLKVNNTKIRKRCEICSKLTMFLFYKVNKVINVLTYVKCFYC